MPRTSKTAADETNDSHLPAAVEANAGTLIISPNPVVIVGVNRRVSLGGYEHIDLYAGVSLPLNVDPGDIEAFQEAMKDAAALGFAQASKETVERYKLIKDQNKPTTESPA